MHLHYAGGSIPSPHAAAATIMWLMAWKHHRPTFYAIAPIILTLYVSTFYGRYHYATDAVVGIVAAAAAALAAPVLLRAFAAGQRALAGVDLG
jgi:membrane-associated phospholipid phosphatase